MHKVKELDDKESLQLFSWHAFGQDHPFESHIELSRNVVYHCGGIPLALQVLGYSLTERSVDIWESAIKKLQAIPNSDILEKLRISYDSLPVDYDKNLFLNKTPDFSGLPNLKRLILKDCIKLVKIYESIGDLERLVFLNLSGCKNLIRLPRNIGKLKSLETLILSGYSKLDKLPMELGKLESLTVMHADDIAINQLASTNLLRYLNQFEGLGIYL